MSNIIAIVFDFDDTLAPDSTSSFLESIGIQTQEFWSTEIGDLLKSDWDPVPAYMHRMIERSKSKNPKGITKEMLVAHGKALSFHPGVPDMFKRLKEYVQKTHPSLTIEFYLISSGIQDVVANTRIAKNFTDIWASDFHYDENDLIAFPRKVVSFTDKTRYIFQISKGIVGSAFRGKPFEVNRKFDDSKLRVPLENMIFVGDGYTDIPCFSLLKKNGGTALGVYSKEDRAKWGRAWGFVDEGRVSNLLSADYGKASDLSNSLIMAVNSVAAKINLRGTSYQR